MRTAAIFLSALVPAALLLGQAGLPAQGPGLPDEPPDQRCARPHVAIPYPSLLTKDVPLLDPPPPSRTARLRLVGMPCGFLTTPFGLLDDEPAAAPADDGGCPRCAEEGPAGVQVCFGNYNPHFDLRRPGDPGGLGFYKLHSQVQLLDAGTTSICLGLQALTPAGIEFGGVDRGPTMLNPTLAWFQDLGEGLAVQGYFGPNIQANSRWTDTLAGSFLYGMALQCPVPGTTAQGDQGVYFTLQALGRYHSDDVRSDGRPLLWEVVPGLHMQWNPNCWMSLGVSRYNFLSCAWQF